MSDRPPSGWYPDPQDPTLQRYWDGFEWTEHTAPGVATAATGEPATAVTAGTGAGAPGTGGTATDQWPSTRPAGGDVNTWTWQSFVVTLLCGGGLISIFGIYNAGKAEGALDAGNVGAAREFARRARNWTLGGLALGVVGVVLVLIFVGALVTASDELTDCAGVTPGDGLQYEVCRTLCEQDPSAVECLLFSP